MSVLYLHFEAPERGSRAQKLAKSGAHVVLSEPRWPGFFELAKKEKPYAIAIDFSYAPSHALETADYLSKARETRDVSFYLLRVPSDRLDIVRKRLPQAPVVTEDELTRVLEQKEKEAEKRALGRKGARRRGGRRKGGGGGGPPEPGRQRKPGRRGRRPPTRRPPPPSRRRPPVRRLPRRSRPRSR